MTLFVRTLNILVPHFFSAMTKIEVSLNSYIIRILIRQPTRFLYYRLFLMLETHRKYWWPNVMICSLLPDTWSHILTDFQMLKMIFWQNSFSFRAWRHSRADKRPAMTTETDAHAATHWSSEGWGSHSASPTPEPRKRQFHSPVARRESLERPSAEIGLLLFLSLSLPLLRIDISSAQTEPKQLSLPATALTKELSRLRRPRVMEW